MVLQSFTYSVFLHILYPLDSLSLRINHEWPSIELNNHYRCVCVCMHASDHVSSMSLIGYYCHYWWNGKMANNTIHYLLLFVTMTPFSVEKASDGRP